jgi:tRNA-(ms[2]io[6]A)-hydroxylase
MLSLHTTTDASWLARVQGNLEELLIDHAHCEKKAAGVAMNFIFYYVEDEELCREMTEIVQEELDHFHQVCELIKSRGWKFRRLTPSSYGHRLHELVRKVEPERAIDRLLVASLIEARSCERFGALREGLADRELADFYGSLFESEARHHTTYVRLAKHYGSEAAVHERLEELAATEAEIIARGDATVRMHS